MSHKAFIFDFDGVVADSLSAHLCAWEYAHLKIYGTELRDPGRLVGRSTQEIGDMLAAEAALPDSHGTLIREKVGWLKEHSGDVDIFPQVRSIFGELTKLGRPFGICSNASSTYINRVLKRHGVICPIVIGLHEVAKAKPAPDGYINCANKLGFSADDYAHIAAFEDSLHGLSAIFSAGMYAVGISTQHEASSLLNHGAKAVYGSLSEAYHAGIFS